MTPLSRTIISTDDRTTMCILAYLFRLFLIYRFEMFSSSGGRRGLEWTFSLGCKIG